jgi:DNA-directed RNA polymerase I, II, and III subunit RPABC2
MLEEIEDIDQDFNQDNDFSEGEDETNDILIDEEDDKNNQEDNLKILTYNNVAENIEKKPKKTIPILTKFERARIRGVRLQQLAYGAKPRVDVTGLKSIEEIVEKELKERKIPFIIKRTLPNNVSEYWKMEEFEVV